MRRVTLTIGNDGRRETYTVTVSRGPLWRLSVRMRRVFGRALRPCRPVEYAFDSDTLLMRDRRRERRAARFGKAARAVLSMVEMQRHIS